jgi:hypothetical protein
MNSYCVMSPLKINFIHLLQLLASADDQDRYQSEVNVDISAELVCMWFDDFFALGERERLAPLLSSRELELVEEFHRYYEARVDSLPRAYAELRESEQWCEVRRKASETITALGWDKVQTVWGFGAV